MVQVPIYGILVLMVGLNIFIYAQLGSSLHKL